MFMLRLRYRGLLHKPCALPKIRCGGQSGYWRRSASSTAPRPPAPATRRRKRACAGSQSCLCSARTMLRSSLPPTDVLRWPVAAVLGSGGQIPAETARRSSAALPVALATKSPKSKSQAESLMLMGEVRQTSGIPPQASEPNLRLEAALDRLLQGIRHCRSG